VNALDTHRLVKRLVAVGFSDEQAETVTDVVREAREADISNLATKADLAQEVGHIRHEIGQLRTELVTTTAQLRTEIAASEARLFASIAECKADILKWVIGLLLVQGGAVVTLIKLLPGH
jgi:hypothetical protein